MSNNLETTGYTATVTGLQYGNEGDKSYLHVQNVGAVVLNFGFGAVVPTTWHTLAVGAGQVWDKSVPSGKIWLQAASTTCAVAITE